MTRASMKVERPEIDLWKREKYLILTWDAVGKCLDSLKSQIDTKGITPTEIVAISRGGMILGTYLGNRYGVRDVQILSIIRNSSDQKRSERGEPVLRWMMPEGSLKGQTVLLADDIAGDGGTLEFALDLLKQRGAERVFTVVVVKNANTRFEPDFHAVEVDEWTIFPWEPPLTELTEDAELIDV